MFTYPQFDVEVIRKVEAEQLGWPDRGEADEDSGLGCNRMYADLRGLSWGDAKKAVALERDLVKRVESAADPPGEYEKIEEDLFESDEGLWGLDLGVASVVVALSAAKCIPFSSCNGGAFGGRHQEIYPVVAFYARPQMLELLIASAEEADVGLEGGEYLVAYANDVRKMHAFAESIIRRRSQFRAIRIGSRRSKEHPTQQQNNLPFM
jgi:hypothetical protein